MSLKTDELYIMGQQSTECNFIPPNSLSFIDRTKSIIEVTKNNGIFNTTYRNKVLIP
jgi:hypothetical protein